MYTAIKRRNIIIKSIALSALTKDFYVLYTSQFFVILIPCQNLRFPIPFLSFVWYYILRLSLGEGKEGSLFTILLSVLFMIICLIGQRQPVSDHRFALMEFDKDMHSRIPFIWRRHFEPSSSTGTLLFPSKTKAMWWKYIFHNPILSHASLQFYVHDQNSINQLFISWATNRLDSKFIF